MRCIEARSSAEGTPNAEPGVLFNFRTPVARALIMEVLNG